MNKKAIPQIAYISKALLAGDVLTVMDGYMRFRCTNLSRELSRSVEQKFGLKLTKDRVDFFRDCGTPGHFYRYRLPFTDYNEIGIIKMRQYVNEFFPTKSETTAIPQTLML